MVAGRREDRRCQRSERLGRDLRERRRRAQSRADHAAQRSARRPPALVARREDGDLRRVQRSRTGGLHGAGRRREARRQRVSAECFQCLLFARWQVDLFPVARTDLEGYGDGRQSAGDRGAARRRAAGGIGRRQVCLLPFAPRYLAGSDGGRRGRRGLRAGARYVGTEQYAAHEEGCLLHRVRTQRPHDGGLVLRFRHEEELRRFPHAQCGLGRRRRVSRCRRMASTFCMRGWIRVRRI